MIFSDRNHAGQVLAGHLASFTRRPDVLVLAIPRDGVPVGGAVARTLDAVLDVVLVRKLAVPGHDELSFGTVATGGIRRLNDGIVGQLGLAGADVAAAITAGQAELLQRERDWRGGRALSPVRDRTVLLVDDSFGSGAAMRAAIAALRPRRPRRIVVAAPCGAAEVCAALRNDADGVVCAVSRSAADCYGPLAPVTDTEVRELLDAAWNPGWASTAA